MRFWDFFGDALKETPHWWWIVSLLLSAVSLVFDLSGHMPDAITHFWPWWFLLITILFFVGSSLGTFEKFKKLEAEKKSEIASARAENLRLQFKIDAKIPALYLKYKNLGSKSRDAGRIP